MTMRRRIFLALLAATAAAPALLRAGAAEAQNAAELRGTWPVWDSARSGRNDPQPYPTGVDLGFVPGLPLTLARPASLQRAELPPARQIGWPSLVATVENPGKALTIRLLGVAAKARPGEPIAAGQPLGLVADAAPLWPGIANHVTLEVYIDGKRVDPRPWLARLLPQGVPMSAAPPAQAAVLWPQWALRAEALRLAKQGDNRTALARLRAALRLPAWKASNLDLAEDASFAARAAQDRRAEAAALQHALGLLRAEIPYAQGMLPAPLLGPVSAARSPASLYALESRLEQRRAAIGPLPPLAADAAEED